MPLYEYRCDGCGHRFETLQRLGARADDLTCPRCDGDHVTRALSTFAAHGGGAGRAAVSEAGCGRPACGTGFT